MHTLSSVMFWWLADWTANALIERDAVHFTRSCRFLCSPGPALRSLEIPGRHICKSETGPASRPHPSGRVTGAGAAITIGIEVDGPCGQWQWAVGGSVPCVVTYLSS